MRGRVLTFFFFFLVSFWLCWVFAAACRLSLVADSRAYCPVVMGGFSLGWPLLLWSTGSKLHGLQEWAACGLSNCGSGAAERRLRSCVWHRLSCLAAGGIFLDHGSNSSFKWCPLHCKAES